MSPYRSLHCYLVLHLFDSDLYFEFLFDEFGFFVNSGKTVYLSIKTCFYLKNIQKMALNHTILSDLFALSKDELIEEYRKVFKSYKTLKEENEMSQQTIYELKRNLNTALNGEAFLNSELESISSVHEKEIEEITKRNQHEIEEIKLRNANLLKNNSNLENEIAELREQINSLTDALAEKPTETSVCLHNKSNGETQEKMPQIESENVELHELVESINEQLDTALKKIIEHEVSVLRFVLFRLDTEEVYQ